MGLELAVDVVADVELSPAVDRAWFKQQVGAGCVLWWRQRRLGPGAGRAGGADGLLTWWVRQEFSHGADHGSGGRRARTHAGTHAHGRYLVAATRPPAPLLRLVTRSCLAPASSRPQVETWLYGMWGIPVPLPGSALAKALAARKVLLEVLAKELAADHAAYKEKVGTASGEVGGL
jgi:hypothetical protein